MGSRSEETAAASMGAMAIWFALQCKERNSAGRPMDSDACARENLPSQASVERD